MNNNRTVARIAGSLFIAGTVSGLLSVVFTGPVLGTENYLTNISTHETQVVLGAICVLIMAFSLAMLPVVLFPIFRKYNETLALGAVLFRGAFEACLYIAIVLVWLLLLVLGRQYASSTDGASVQVIATLLRAAETWSTHMLSIVFSLGALMIYWLFTVSRLIPRWLALWGVAGAVLYLAVPVLALFGFDQFGFLMAPLALQEMVLALWLIVKGFSPKAVAPASL